MSKPWTNKPFDCCKNPVMCMIPCCIPCGFQLIQACAVGVAFKDTSFQTNFNKAYFCAMFLCTFGSAYNRTKLRHKLDLKGACITDLLFHLFCPCAASVQEWRQTLETTLNNDINSLLTYVMAKPPHLPKLPDIKLPSLPKINLPKINPTSDTKSDK
jgi:Cys-rich protein (TIGR01571 family)